jgi:hypothetical protein
MTAQDHASTPVGVRDLYGTTSGRTSPSVIGQSGSIRIVFNT